MSSTSKGKTDPQVRVDADEALIFPVNAEPSDDTPTIISKNHPTVEPRLATGANQHDAAIKASPDSLGNGLRGRRLAHFELIEPIGVGGMAAVLRARDTQLDREVALKILPPEMATDPENVRRFHQEARAAARLDHPNIARVFFCGEDQGLHFIAFEFVEGQNIRTLLERRGRLPVHEAVRYVLQVATGLEHAAARGVVHRDVKPSNIIVSPNGHAKLVDMGLARHMERQGDADLTQSGVTLGTFDYISPEQALEPRDADARSDIYSLGCTFYHMLTGVPPVPEGTAAKKLHHHQHIAPVDPRQLNPEIPDDIAMILSRMMEKDPRRRYQRPLQLVQHLMQVARKVGAADDLPEGVLFVDAPLPAGPRSRPVIIIALPFLVLGVLITLLALNPSDPRDSGPVVVNKDQSTAATTDKKKDGQAQETRPAVTKTVLIPEDKVVTKAKDLEMILRDPSLRDRREIKLSGIVNLADFGEFGFEGGAAVDKPLTFTSSKLGLATLSFDTDSRNANAGLEANPAGLTILGGYVIFDNLKIQVKATLNWEEAVAAIAVRGAPKVVFKRCQFEQDTQPYTPGLPGIASVLIQGVRNAEHGPGGPRIEFQECCFTGKDLDHAGQVAVAVSGPADLRVLNCGFGRHATLFQLRKGCQLADTAVRLDHCSAFVFDGPVFGFYPGAGAALHATASLFSRYEDQTSVAAEHPPNLIHQTDDSPIQYLGKENCYHHLNALWEFGSLLVNSLENFKAALRKRASGADDSTRELLLGQSESPWNADKPLKLPAEQAFQVKPDFDRIGLQSCYWGNLDRPSARDPFLEANEKLFDPDYKGKNPRIRNSFEGLLFSLVKGDTLLVKPGKDGAPIELPPILIRNPASATIKAWPNTAPVLKLALAEKSDAAFFRLHEGRLRFEGLHFLLEARPEMVGPLAVLKIGDNVQASFDRCVITLKANGNNAVSVVSLIDPKERMMPKSDVPPPNSRVQFANSFIRGDGDLANLCTCRRVQIGLDNSLVAVSGSLFDLDVKSDDPPSEQGPQLDLTRSSVFTREPVFSLNSTKTGKGLGRIHVEAKGCLFAAAAPAKRPLIYLRAPAVLSEAELSKYLDWKGEQNSYARFDKLLEYERPDEMGTAMQLPPVEWGKLFGEPQYGKDEIGLPPLSDLVLTQVRPSDLRPTDTDVSVPGVGSLADLDPLLKAFEPR